MAGIGEIGTSATSPLPLGRLAGLLRDRSEAGLARRFAAGAFLARVLNAGLGFLTQIFLARWMGERDYGLYSSVWAWILVAGGMLSLGLPVAALRFVPEYRERGDAAGLRGFLLAARRLGPLPGIAFALAGVAAILLFGDRLGPYGSVALVALVALPIYVLTDIQTGIARAFDFADLGLAADYLLRPLLLLVFAGAIWAAGGPGTAAAVMGATVAAVAFTALGQGLALGRRLAARVPAGARRLDVGRWSAASWPLLTVTGFTLLLGATDILILPLFVPPEEVAVYVAATKIVAVASFVSYGVANTSAHRFAAQQARGDGIGMARVAAETVRWTFWPTLAVALLLAAAAGPLLRLFGPGFESGGPLVAILAAGLVAGAAVGPADRALSMADHGRLAASIYGVAFLANAVLCLALVPRFGLAGAAAATALATAIKAGSLFVAARRRLGLTMIVGASASTAPGASAGVERVSAELLTPEGAARIRPAWDDLARRAVEPNPFYGPDRALPGLRHLPEGRGARILVAWSGEGRERRLVGLLPLAAARGRYINPAPMRRAAAVYGTLSTPLLDADRPAATLAAMLEAARRAGIRSLLLPHLHDAGAVAAALSQEAAATGRPVLRLDEHRRAMLRSGLPGAEYMRATLETRRRKEADRQRRRLAEEGALAFRVARSPDEVAAALEHFLALEAAGWKGRAGTDLLHAAGAAAFARESALEGARAGTFRVALLLLDGRPVAAGLVAVAGRRAFYLKTAYDEALARFSPGLLLTLDLTAHLLDDPDIDDADSIAVADHPMIDRVWTERFPVASLLVATAPGGGVGFRLAALLERGREAAWARIKARRARSDASAAPGANDDGKKAAPAPAA